MIAGSDDFEIRIFKNDTIVNEMTETDSVKFLVAYNDGRFAYALANGTVGMYEKYHRLWRVKVKFIFLRYFSQVLYNGGKILEYHGLSII